MITAIDTNLLSALLSKEPRTQAARNALAQCRRDGAIVLSPVAYAEILAYPRMTEGFLQLVLDRTQLGIDFAIGRTIWTEAGKRYSTYAARRREGNGGDPRRLLADFFIGTHALLNCDRLLTFDGAFFVRNFPELPIFPL